MKLFNLKLHQDPSKNCYSEKSRCINWNKSGQCHLVLLQETWLWLREQKHLLMTATCSFLSIPLQTMITSRHQQIIMSVWWVSKRIQVPLIGSKCTLLRYSSKYLQLMEMCLPIIRDIITFFKIMLLNMEASSFSKSLMAQLANLLSSVKLMSYHML